MTERKTVPVAYVTKWAETRGILVWKDAEVSDGGYLYRQKREGEWMTVSVSSKHWTEDKSEAEKRWRAAMAKAHNAAQAKAQRIAKALTHGPKWEEP